jgi:hypothetical protein
MALGLQLDAKRKTNAYESECLMNALNFRLACMLLAATGASFAQADRPRQKTSEAQSAVVSPRKVADLPKAERLPARDTARLRNIGAKVFRIEWSGKLVAVSAHGFQAITDGTTTVSYRPAGNAYFVQIGKPGRSGKSAFRGTDEELVERGKAILAGLGIRSNEIADSKILQQYVTEGVMNPDTRKLEVNAPRKDRRSLIVRRVVDGIPVLNSRLALDLDAEGKIAALELSWPVINPKVLEEARRLQRLAKSDFKAPERKGARIESVQVGILHSPAASFVEDQVAAIQVIYAPNDPRMGMKPVAYLDSEGRPVAIPRQMIAKTETPADGRRVPEGRNK